MWCLSPAFGPSWCHPSRHRRRDSSRKKGAKGRSILHVSWRMPIDQLLTHSPNSQVDACAHFDFISFFFLRVLREKQILQKKKKTNKMFGGLPTPTETEAPDNVLTSGPASTTTSVDYHHHHHHDHPDCDGSPGSHEDHSGHLTTSQSAHITLR